MAEKLDLPEKLFPRNLEIDEDLDAEELWKRATAGVRRLSSQGKGRRVRRMPAEQRALAWEHRSNPLLDFVRGHSEFDWRFHSEYLEGGPEAWNRPLLRKLRRGAFSVEAELDLHGFSREEARSELEAFLHRCCRAGKRCVRIIHGKGRNSPQGRGVLKEKLSEWLRQERMKRYIVVYASAPPSDGGVGAMYILLRKRPGARKGRRSGCR